MGRFGDEFLLLVPEHPDGSGLPYFYTVHKSRVEGWDASNFQRALLLSVQEFGETHLQWRDLAGSSTSHFPFGGARPEYFPFRLDRPNSLASREMYVSLGDKRPQFGPIPVWSRGTGLPVGETARELHTLTRCCVVSVGGDCRSGAVDHL
jgi:hypothetical protein